MTLTKMFLQFHSSSYGILGLSYKTSPNGWSYEIPNNVLKLSHHNRVVGDYYPMQSISSLETGNFKIVLDRGKKQVILSEYALGVESALIETEYTPKGKKTHERSESIFRRSPITMDDYCIVEDKIEKALREAALRTPARIPLEEESIARVYLPTLPERPRLEKIMRNIP